MKKQEKNNPLLKHKKILGIILLLIIYSILITGSTYAFMSFSANSTAATGTGGCFQVSYTGQEITGGDFLSTDNYLEGANTTVTLSKDASCKIYTEANIYLHTNNTTTAPIESTPALRFKIFDGTTEISEGLISNKENTLLTTVPITNSSVTYTIYLWVDNNLSDGLYHDTVYSGYIYAESAQTSTVENSYLVNFNTSGGNEISQKVVTYGSTYGTLPTPTRSGYTFKGWSLTPSEYQQVEYIQSSGTQYIDTGYKPNYDKNIHIEIVFKPTTSNARYCLLSNYNGTNHLSLELLNNAGRAYYNNATFDVKIGTMSTTNKNTYIFDYNTINNIYNFSFNNSSTSNTMNATGTSGKSMLIFVDQLKRFTQFTAPLEIYSLKIVENSVILRNLIPCKNTMNNNEVGLYDTVTGKFYGNDGTGSFTAGNATYITSSSTVNEANNHTLYAVWEPKTYTVTLNANEGTVSPTTMQVTYNTPYSDLPTPTRSGYTFKGWTNTIFSDSDLINSTKWTANQNVTVTKNSSYVQVIYNQNTSTPGYIYRYENSTFEIGKTYTVTLYVKGINTNKLSIGVYGKTYADYTNLSTTEFKRISTTFTFTSSTQNFILLYQLAPTIGTGFQIKYVQFQEGEVATDYNVSSITKATQPSNHTLTAIWEQN